MTDPTVPSLGRDWCPYCHRSQDVVDRYPEDTGDSRVMVEVYSVTVFACGHDLTVKTGEYRSPLQQAGPPRSAFLPDPFLEVDE
jgi:hypothetical protein